MISALCVYNDAKALEEMLLPSLRRQRTPHEELLADNSGGRYRSAAEALNELGARASGKYLMIAHQDIAIEDPDFLEKTERALDALLPFGAAGAAGRGPGSGGPRTAIECGVPPRVPGALLLETTRVQTLDECLFFIPAEVFRRLRFDADACDGWHLYAVDYCLSVKEELGLEVLALPLRAYHRSAGVVNRSYFAALKRVLRKHSRRVPRIYTTVGVWATDFPVLRAAFYRGKLALYATLLGQWLSRQKERLVAMRGGF
jgi:hypothetical protein